MNQPSFLPSGGVVAIEMAVLAPVLFVLLCRALTGAVRAFRLRTVASAPPRQRAGWAQCIESLTSGTSRNKQSQVNVLAGTPALQR